MNTTKTIHLELKPEQELDFYYKLYQVKVTKEIRNHELTAFMDTIQFDETKAKEFLDLPFNQRKIILSNLRRAWQYLYKVRTYHESYNKIACIDFKSFRKTAFGKDIISYYYVINKLVEYWEDENPIEIKSALAYLSVKANQYRARLHKAFFYYVSILQFLPENLARILKQTNNGFLLEPVEAAIQVKIHYEKDGVLHEIRSFQEWEEIKNSYYLCYQLQDELIWIKKQSNGERILIRELYAYVGNGHVITSSETRSFVFKLEENKPLQNLWNNRNEQKLPYETVIHYYEIIPSNATNEKRNSIIPEIEKINLLEMIKELPPLGKTRELYKRDLLIKRILELVTFHFPSPVSDHVRHNVTGYLCIPFGVIDTEDEHIDSDRATATHHEYVGKTIRNSLKRKPY
jgi:hypothetical protein